ncbi:MAG: hypothetical protein LBF91_09220 [Azoarcus sp.]|jgi:hypothetical protein|nr:hypothetical protein [Azoarcus sp.]
MSGYSAQGAAEYALQHAAGVSVGSCAKYVRLAIKNGGGANIGQTLSAKNYGPLLLPNGFYEISAAAPRQVGDIAVIQPSPNTSQHGHMAIFVGHYWVSDFVQNNGYYPSQTYRNDRPPVKFYRRTN